MQELHTWFNSQKRWFPWRENKSPYTVWVSEIMLQQTRASVVIPYYERWMREFPTLLTLAKAPLERVIKMWEGLGYYSRARNLHKGAQYIVKTYGDSFPNTFEELRKIPGVGPYTAGAILSFGFHQRSVAVDGNVTRVIARFQNIEGSIEKAQTKSRIIQETEALLDTKEPWVTMEALIELGASLCSPYPKCLICPLQKSCKAHGQGKEFSLPVKGEIPQVTEIKRAVGVFFHEKTVLLRKGEAKKVMADLYEFPYLEIPVPFSKTKVKEAFETYFSLHLEWIQTLPGISHTFTRFKALLYPHVFQVALKKEIPGYNWIPLEGLKDLPFSSGHKKILERL